MALSSSMLPLGTIAPAFSLPNVSTGHEVSLADFADKEALLVMFICKHCPYVVHVRPELARIGMDFEDCTLGIVAISSNDPVAYPDDSPENLKQMAHEAGFRFPVLFDETQDVARAYDAVCTPDFFLFDRDRKLVYRGRLDETRPTSGTADGMELRAAIEAVLNHRPVSPEQTPSVGCGIKWKK
ncbi:MAG: thioredoxin family protein [Chthoniobacteraceae bacterium]|jgi:peroxiredoxin